MKSWQICLCFNASGVKQSSCMLFPGLEPRYCGGWWAHGNLNRFWWSSFRGDFGKCIYGLLNVKINEVLAFSENQDLGLRSVIKISPCPLLCQCRLSTGVLYACCFALHFSPVPPIHYQSSSAAAQMTSFCHSQLFDIFVNVFQYVLLLFTRSCFKTEKPTKQGFPINKVRAGTQHKHLFPFCSLLVWEKIKHTSRKAN